VTAAGQKAPLSSFALNAIVEWTRRAHAATRYEIARGQATFPEVLTALADDPGAGVRLAVARNLTAPAAAVTLLADDPSLPAEMQPLLAGSHHQSVRVTIARRRDIIPDAQTILALLAHATDEPIIPMDGGQQ
jgi:riboflavin biosynthesis pyrimidine reductase